MLHHAVHKRTLIFKKPSGTSRGVLKTKTSWFIHLWDEQDPGVVGIGECSIIEGLSPDPLDYLEKLLDDLSWSDQGLSDESRSAIKLFPAVQFAVEMAVLDLKGGGKHLLFASPFTEGLESIDINGLIWMGDLDFMQAQIRDKIDLGFRCVKMKIGAIDFETELAILRGIRKEFSKNDIELRVDANGAFTPEGAPFKLQRLSQLDLHSIEQPIRQGQINEMARLCDTTPIPIALDEELIGINNIEDKQQLLNDINPQFIILKPSLVGGFKSAEEWIDSANARDKGWWITSALESNIGLNAIAQWAATLDSDMYQGLGTGALYINNIDSPLYLEGDRLYHDSEGIWGTL